MADRSPVIDADGHILERQDDIRKYLEPPWDRRPTPLTTDREAWDTSLFGKLPGYPGYVNGMSPTEQVELWLKIMDEAGMEQAVLFPTALGGMVRLPERDFCIAACRAANEHFAKDYNTLSDRIHVVGLLPLNWPEDAAKELRRAVTELGLVSFELPAIGPSVALGDPMYDPLWEEAERLNVPLAVHGGRSPSQVTGASALRTFGEVHAYAFPAGILLQFTSIVMQGVPVRFPKLRWCFLEIGATWLPFWLDRLDEHWELRGDIESPDLKKKPSAIVRESPIYISLEAEETLLPQTVDYLGNDHFMYASDIPHWDGGYPKNLDDLWEHPDLSRETKEKIAYHNAKAFFGLGAKTAVPAR